MMGNTLPGKSMKHPKEKERIKKNAVGKVCPTCNTYVK